MGASLRRHRVWHSSLTQQCWLRLSKAPDVHTTSRPMKLTYQERLDISIMENSPRKLASAARFETMKSPKDAGAWLVIQGAKALPCQSYVELLLTLTLMKFPWHHHRREEESSCLCLSHRCEQCYFGTRRKSSWHSVSNEV